MSKIVDELLTMIRTNQVSTVSVRRVFNNALAHELDEFFLDEESAMSEEESELIARALFPFKGEIAPHAYARMVGIDNPAPAGDSSAPPANETNNTESTGAGPGNDSAPGDAGNATGNPENNPNGEQNHE